MIETPNVSTKSGPIAARYISCDAERSQILENVRRCTALTIPGLLPPIGQQDNSDLPQSYQSTGSRGCNNVTGRVNTALYPVDRPFFGLVPTGSVRYSQEAKDNPEKLQKVLEDLFLVELMIQAKLEAVDLAGGTESGEQRTGFRTQNRAALLQLVVTGDVLEQMTDDYRTKVFRRDQYVTKRNSAGDILFHIVVETIDPLSLTEEQFRKSKLDRREVEAKQPHERQMNIWTLVEWQPKEKHWKICQEVNGEEINESKEPVSPFFATPFDLVAGEDYGRGLVELNLGDLTSLNELCKRLIDLMGLAAKGLIGLDYSARTKERDLEKKPGSMIRCRVADGKAQDICTIRFDVGMESQLLTQAIERLERNLGKSFLMESESAPQGEAGRSPVSWQRIALELEGQLGSLYAPIADYQQIPRIRRCIHLLKKNNELPAGVRDDLIEIKAVTGLAALNRESRLGKIMSFTEIMARMGESTMANINMTVWTKLVARYSVPDEPGLVYTEAEMEARKKQAMQDQAAMAASQQAIETTGAIAENAAQQAGAQPQA